MSHCVTKNFSGATVLASTMGDNPCGPLWADIMGGPISQSAPGAAALPLKRRKRHFLYSKRVAHVSIQPNFVPFPFCLALVASKEEEEEKEKAASDLRRSNLSSFRVVVLAGLGLNECHGSRLALPLLVAGEMRRYRASTRGWGGGRKCHHNSLESHLARD